MVAIFEKSSNPSHPTLSEAAAKTVYVRSVLVADLPDDVKKKAEGAEHLYAVHNEDGDRMAIVTNRSMAFALAREHNFTPVNVH